MSSQNNNILFFAGVAAGLFILGGCVAQVREPARVSPGKKSVAESLSSLRLRLESAAPIKADGQCLLQYHDKKGELKREHFPVKLWMNPPVEIYMQGDVAFDPKGIVIGSNNEEFWLAVRLKEVSGYWWGQWSEKDYPGGLMISPRLVLEALGAVAAADEEVWSLSKEGEFDVLIKQEGGIETKKICISTSDYLIRKIEYFSRDGRAIVIMELSKYRKITENFFIPGIVKIANSADSDKGDSVKIILGFVKQMEFTDKQQRQLFSRPHPQGFRHIYKVVDGKIIEQPK